MSLEVFQLLDNTAIDTSITKRGFLEKYHEHGAQIIQENQDFDLFFGESKNFYQISNGYFEFEVPSRKNGGNSNIVNGDSNVDEPIRLANNAFAYVFSIATLLTTGHEETEQKYYQDHVSTVIRLLTSRDGDLLSYFEKIGDTQIGIKGSSFSRILIGIHEEVANGGKVKRHLILEHNLRFFKTFKKVKKS